MRTTKDTVSALRIEVAEAAEAAEAADAADDADAEERDADLDLDPSLATAPRISRSGVPVSVAAPPM